jgi:acetylglutamate synthase
MEKDIAQKLQDTKVYPLEAVQMRMQLSGLYSFYSQNLEDILTRKPATWQMIRLKHKSDKQAELEWSATEDGKNEIGLSMRLKRISAMMSALKSTIDSATTDYHYHK